MPMTTRITLTAAAIAALWVVAPADHAQAEGGSMPNIAGTYQCKPDPRPCIWPGSSPSIFQSGDKLEIKNDKGETADGAFTSNMTLTAAGPLNSLGIIRTDHSIDWSDGTTWRKD
jgi:hypothetical protein